MVRTWTETCRQFVLEWCKQHGYTEPVLLDDQWWAFPPGGVIPVCLTSLIYEDLKAKIIEFCQSSHKDTDC